MPETWSDTVPAEQIGEGGQWAILELMGHKTVAGLLSNQGIYGTGLLRMDVPATTTVPAFTQYYSAQAVYCITLVSEAIARHAAAQLETSALPVYVPELVTIEQHREEIARRDRTIARLEDQARARQMLAEGQRLMDAATSDEDPGDDDDESASRDRRTNARPPRTTTTSGVG